MYLLEMNYRLHGQIGVGFILSNWTEDFRLAYVFFKFVLFSHHFWYDFQCFVFSLLAFFLTVVRRSAVKVFSCISHHDASHWTFAGHLQNAQLYVVVSKTVCFLPSPKWIHFDNDFFDLGWNHQVENDKVCNTRTYKGCFFNSWLYLTGFTSFRLQLLSH